MCRYHSQYTANTGWLWAAQRHVVGRGPAHWKVNRARLFTVSSFTGRWNVCSWLRAARIAHHAPAITSTQVRTTYGKSLPQTVPYETVNVRKIYDNVHGISHFSLFFLRKQQEKEKKETRIFNLSKRINFKLGHFQGNGFHICVLILYIFNFIFL